MRGSGFTALIVLPLLAFALIIYNLVVIIGFTGNPDQIDAWLTAPIFTISMFSGDKWDVSFSDVFLGLSLMLLFVEMTKATRTDSLAIINHGLSMLVAVICIIEFVAVRGFSNSVFFMLLLMTIFDVVAGFTITIVAAKRDFGSSAGIVGTN
jgi:hypothetical protein